MRAADPAHLSAAARRAALGYAPRLSARAVRASSRTGEWLAATQTAAASAQARLPRDLPRLPNAPRLAQRAQAAQANPRER